MSYESFDDIKFDLGPFLQGQTESFSLVRCLVSFDFQDIFTSRGSKVDYFWKNSGDSCCHGPNNLKIFFILIFLHVTEMSKCFLAIKVLHISIFSLYLTLRKKHYLLF